jgi:hypothetical protein
MARRLRSAEEDKSGLRHVFERMVKRMRNKVNTVLWKIERSRHMSPQALKSMIKIGLESNGSEVEKVMNGVSYGMEKWKRRGKRCRERKEQRRWRKA